MGAIALPDALLPARCGFADLMLVDTTSGSLIIGRVKLVAVRCVGVPGRFFHRLFS
jgi:hypothetical protein